MYEGVDTVVLYDELAYQDVLPVQWLAVGAAGSVRADRTGGVQLLLLQACVSVEEHPARDKNEDLGPLAGEIARLDFKLNLVMQLLSKLVAKDRMPPRPRSSSTASAPPGPASDRRRRWVAWIAARAAAQLVCRSRWNCRPK
jgi:hypothetical protein